MTKKPELPGAGHKWLDWSPSAKEEIEAYGEAMAAWEREQELEDAATFIDDLGDKGNDWLVNKIRGLK